MSEQNIVSQIRNVTSNGSPPSPTSSAEQTIPQSIRITQTIQYKAMTVCFFVYLLMFYSCFLILFL